jgi:hypothetical protein
MNQRTIIYIILSAILLYLYYRRRDLAIFAVFIVVVGATLIFGNGSASEGFDSKESKKTGDKTKNLDDKKKKTGTKKDSINDAKDEDKDDDKNKNKKKTKTSNAADNKAADDKAADDKAADDNEDE